MFIQQSEYGSDPIQMNVESINKLLAEITVKFSDQYMHQHTNNNNIW